MKRTGARASVQRPASKEHAGHENSPLDILSPEKMEHNRRSMDYCRTFVAIVAGCATGVAGYTGLAGLACYFLVSLLVSAGIVVSAGTHHEHYLQSIPGVFLGGLMNGLGSFILFWTMAYDIVHIYG